MRLDGYYALADLLGVHNLRRRGRERWLHYIRWMLWGGQRPEPLADGLALFWYGMISWTFKIGVLSAIFLHLTQWLQSLMGVAGFLAGAMLFITLAKKYVKGSVGGEFTNMLRARKKRAIILGVLGLGVLLVPIYDRAGGPFSVRPVVRWEVRAPVAGFLREVLVDEGDRVSAGAVLARMAVPELESQITRKQAEIRESEANLRRLEAGRGLKKWRPSARGVASGELAGSGPTGSGTRPVQLYRGVDEARSSHRTGAHGTGVPQRDLGPGPTAF